MGLISKQANTAALWKALAKRMWMTECAFQRIRPVLHEVILQNQLKEALAECADLRQQIATLTAQLAQRDKRNQELNTAVGFLFLLVLQGSGEASREGRAALHLWSKLEAGLLPFEQVPAPDNPDAPFEERNSEGDTYEEWSQRTSKYLWHEFKEDMCPNPGVSFSPHEAWLDCLAPGVVAERLGLI